MRKIIVLSVILSLVLGYVYEGWAEIQTGQEVTPETKVEPEAKVEPVEPEKTQEEAIKIGESAGRIFVTMGQSKLLTVGEDVVRVSVTTPEVATVQAISKRQVLIDGKKPGVTTMIIWDIKDKTYIHDITVQRDVALLKERLQEIDKNIQVEVQTAQDTVILWGEVDSPAKITKAITIAASFFGDTELQVLAGPGGTIVTEGYRPKPLNFAAQGTAIGQTGAAAFQEISRVWNVGEGAIIATKNGKVISFLKLKDPLQVELKVHFLQVDLTLLRELGFDTLFNALGFPTNPIFETSTTGFSTTGTIKSPDGLSLSPDTGGSGVIRFLVVQSQKNLKIRAQMRALEEKQVIKTLSEPNLTVISGQEATFLLGGEFPFLVPQQTSGATFQQFFTVQWKAFGNKLELVPEVKENNMINLKLSPEVSERSEELGVNFPLTSNAVITIPGLKTRRTETTVEMMDGDSLIIAGLLQDNERLIRTQVPYIGSIPVLGTLFRRSLKRHERTELIIVVTPRLVKPMSPKEAESVTQAEMSKWNNVYQRFLEKIFEPSRWLVGPFGHNRYIRGETP